MDLFNAEELLEVGDFLFLGESELKTSLMASFAESSTVGPFFSAAFVPFFEERSDRMEDMIVTEMFIMDQKR